MESSVNYEMIRSDNILKNKRKLAELEQLFNKTSPVTNTDEVLVGSNSNFQDEIAIKEDIKNFPSELSDELLLRVAEIQILLKYFTSKYRQYPLQIFGPSGSGKTKICNACLGLKVFKTLPKLSFNCYGILDWGIFLCRLWNAIFDTLMSIECLKNDAKVKEFENINKRSFGSIEDFVVPFEQLLGLCSSLSGDQFLFLLVLDRVDTNNSSFPISNFVDKICFDSLRIVIVGHTAIIDNAMTLNLAPYDDKSLEKIIRSMLSTNERSLIAMDYQFCECRRETDLLLKNILPVMTMYTGNPRSAYAFVQAIRSYWCRMNCSPAQTDRVVTTNSFNSNDTSDYTHRSWHLDQSIIGKKKDIKQLSYLSDAVDRQKCQMFTGLSPHMEKSMILPQDRRILIVASFIASHSPKEMDANIFLPLSRGKKSKRNHLREENSINESNKKYYFDDSRLVNLFLCLRNVVNSDQSILRNILSKVSKHRTDSKLSDSDVQIMTQVNDLVNQRIILTREIGNTHKHVYISNIRFEFASHLASSVNINLTEYINH